MTQGSRRPVALRKESIQADQIKQTPKRYLILFLFFVVITIDSFQWLCYSSIANVIGKYHNVDSVTVNSIASIAMVAFLILALPVNLLMEQIGIRRSMLIGAVGTTLGLLIKCFSIQQDRFHVAVVGHVLIGLVEPFYYSTNSRLARIWFPDDQVGLATAICLIADSFGSALAFTLPGFLVGSDIDDDDRIDWGLRRLVYGTAAVSVFNTLLIIIFFDEQPKFAPGMARFKQINKQLSSNHMLQSSVMDKLKMYPKLLTKFFKNKTFIIIAISFGMIVGSDYALEIILNQVIVEDIHFSLRMALPMLGKLGLIFFAADVIGSLVSGMLLDRFNTYKQTGIITCFLTLLSLVAFTLGLSFGIKAIFYLAAIPIGVAFTGYACSGYEFAVEVTYPESELLSSTLLNISAQVFAILITLSSSKMVDTYGSEAGCWFICAAIATGLILTCLAKADYRRQQAIAEGSYDSNANLDSTPDAHQPVGGKHTPLAAV